MRIVDYQDIIYIPKEATINDRIEVYEELRRIASKHNIAIICNGKIIGD